MNDTVQKLVDLLFNGKPENEETRAIHEELSNNCQEHFEDLTARGFSVDEAIGEVVSSLKGMEEVIDQAAGQGNPDLPATVPSREEFDDRTANVDMNAVSALQVETGAESVELMISENGRFSCAYDGKNDAIPEVKRKGDQLTIRMTRPTDNSGIGSFFHADENGGINLDLKGMLGFALGKFVKISLNGNGCLKIRIPPTALKQISISSRAGDLKAVCMATEEIRMNSTAGNIALENLEPCGKISLNTTSGDIRVNGKTERLVISTMSGDVKTAGFAGAQEIKTVSGDIQAMASGDSIRLNAVSGDIHVSPAHAADLTAQTVSGDAEILVPEGCGVDLQTTTVSGDIEGKTRTDGPNGVIRGSIHTISGDITIR